MAKSYATLKVSEVAQSSPTLIPWTVAYQAPLSGIFQARVLEWVAISFSKEGPLGPYNQLTLPVLSAWHLFYFGRRERGKV